MDELDFRPEIWAMRLPCVPCVPSGPITKTLDRFIISSLALHVFLFPLVASPSLQMSSPNPSLLIPVFALRPQQPSVHHSLFFFLFFLAARRPVFYNDISACNVLWSWLIHRWLDEIHSFFFFSPAVPHLPIKHRLSLSNWYLSWWRCVILKFGDFRCCRAGCDTGNSYSWFFKFVASDKS